MRVIVNAAQILMVSFHPACCRAGGGVGLPMQDIRIVKAMLPPIAPVVLAVA